MKHRMLLMLCIVVLVILPACGSGADNKEQIENVWQEDKYFKVVTMMI